MVTSPSARRSAVSTASVSRRIPSPSATSRSTTTSMSCLRVFASFGTSSIGCTVPSTRTRA